VNVVVVNLCDSAEKFLDIIWTNAERLIKMTSGSRKTMWPPPPHAHIKSKLYWLHEQFQKRQISRKCGIVWVTAFTGF